jgi:hypothetical protein
MPNWLGASASRFASERTPMPTTPDNTATSWRDIADQLTPKQIAGLERSKRDLTAWVTKWRIFTVGGC